MKGQVIWNTSDLQEESRIYRGRANYSPRTFTTFCTSCVYLGGGSSRHFFSFPISQTISMKNHLALTLSPGLLAAWLLGSQINMFPDYNFSFFCCCKDLSFPRLPWCLLSGWRRGWLWSECSIISSVFNTTTRANSLVISRQATQQLRSKEVKFHLNQCQPKKKSKKTFRQESCCCRHVLKW